MRALVTGGSGFVGGAVVRLLLRRGAAVRSLARSDAPTLRALGVETHRGSLAEPDAVERAVAGCDVVFHVGAKAGIWGRATAYRDTNVWGTRLVIAACRRHGVGRLVHTSTPSVVHTGHDIAGADERLPYATRFAAPYPASKAVAERDVLAANGRGLATIALRPHLVWGPGDTHLVPRIVERARAGQLRFVGDGQALIDSTFVDNVAEAHLLAADHLTEPLPHGRSPAGRAYFISQGEPLPVMELVNRILAAAGLPPERRCVPLPLAWAAGAAAEVAWRTLRRDDDPPMTRFLARQLATAHWFDLTASRRDLGYGPRISLTEGLARLASAYGTA